MQLLSPIENSHSTLCSTLSTKSAVIDLNDNDNENDDNDSDSDLSLNECDMTLVDDDDLCCAPKNDAEMMFFQVVEILRFEQEVCHYFIFYSLALFIQFN